MSERDVCTKHQVESISELSIDDKYKALGEFEPEWDKEFAEHGINRLNTVNK